MPRAARQDFYVAPDGTLDVVLKFSCNGEVMDLSGWSAAGRITDPDGTSRLRLSNSAGPGHSGLGIIDLTLGSLELYVANADLANLTSPAPYSIVLTNPGGDAQPYMSGYIYVEGA